LESARISLYGEDFYSSVGRMKESFLHLTGIAFSFGRILFPLQGLA
jgi:hypothetical protein